MSRCLYADRHRVLAIHPATGEICDAILEEDWFGPMRDGIRFPGINSAVYAAEDIMWEFAE